MSDDGESLTSRPQSPASAVPDNLHAVRPYRFNWDPSSRRPGPESVSGTTEGRGGGDYFSAQPRLTLPTASSGLSLLHGSLPQDWSSSKHGFHAISTVLNHPHKRQAPPKAHSSLPAAPPVDLPRVRRKDFDPYLHEVTLEWDRFQHNIQPGREGLAQIGAGPSIFQEGDSDVIPPNISGIINPSSIPPLDSVPSTFFQQDFNLGDPRVFDAVTERYLPPDMDLSALAHSLPLLEQFSFYADTVEQHLVHEISLRSTSFFAALTNLRDLQSESEHCLTQIASLRKSLTTLDENSAKRGLELVKQQARVTNLLRVINDIKMVSGVAEMTKVARSLVSAGQWGEGLDIIEELKKLWEGKEGQCDRDLSRKLAEIEEEVDGQELQGESSRLPPVAQHSNSAISHSVPLSSLKAYVSLPDHLRVLTTEIAASLSSELVIVLRTDLIDRINGSNIHTHGTENDKTSEIRATKDQGLRDRLRPLVQGLSRTRGLKEGLLSWREVTLGEVKAVVKARLPAIEQGEVDFDSQRRRTHGDTESSRESTPRPSLDVTSRTGAAAHLRVMRHTEFMLLLEDIHRALLNLVKGLQSQGQVMEEILGVIRDSEASSKESSAASVTVQDEIADLLFSAAEASHVNVSKIIAFRTEEHAALELEDFLTFFNGTWGFVVQCEVICRRMIVGLRGAVVSQCKAKLFLQAFHQSRLTRSAKLVEEEQWNPAEISPSLQHITNVIVESAVRDAPELTIKSDATVLTDPDAAVGDNVTPKAADVLTGRQSNSSIPTSSSKHLRIEDRTYFAVSATTEVLPLLLDYLRLVVNLSLLSTDSMSRIIEFLKAFNSRTCQVVLGAGAMRSAGLKNITAKHLALASQSLSIMSDLIPYVREAYRRHLSPKQAVILIEFDKLKRDYQEHQNEIHSKLIAIMGDRLTAHIKTLQAVDWKVPKPGGGVNDYMEILVKETVTLHKVLSRYLSTQVVEYVMTQVFAAINHGLSEEYSKIELPHQEAKTRLLEDARYLHQKLSTLKNVGMPSSMLVTVVQEKGIPRPAGAPPMPTRSSTMQTVQATANQRLKGLLSRSPTIDKALPIPQPTGTPSHPPPPPGSTPGMHADGHSNLNDNADDAVANGIVTPPLDAGPSAASKQVDGPSLNTTPMGAGFSESVDNENANQMEGRQTGSSAGKPEIVGKVLHRITDPPAPQQSASTRPLLNEAKTSLERSAEQPELPHSQHGD